jgi:hypothetical protein
MLREKRKVCLWEKEVEKKAGGGKESNGGREREVLKNPMEPIYHCHCHGCRERTPIRVGDIHRGAIRSVGWAEANQKANEGCAANKQPDIVILSDRCSL